ncbi:MAG: hypothetical protein AABZ30_13625 [Myxococcota bacterium]
MSRNLAMVSAVARQLGALREEVVFLGGATLDFHVTDPVVKAKGLRPTTDVDVIVDITSQAEYHRVLRTKLIAARFSENTSDGVICRWDGPAGIKVDVMPTDSTVLGFSNRWYLPAMHHDARHDLDGMSLRVISAPYFLATKLDAFRTRGHGDYMASHDLEDLVTVLDGRPAIVSEVAASPEDLRDYLAREVTRLLDVGAENATDADESDRGLFLDALPGHLQGDSDRQQFVLERLERIRTRGGVGAGSRVSAIPTTLAPVTLPPPAGRLLAVDETESARFSSDILRWREGLPRDLETLREVLLDRRPPPAAKRLVVGAMAYRLRTMDLIPDHFPDVGLVDDCCVMRVAADLFLRHKIENLPLSTLQKVGRLASDVERVQALLGPAAYKALEDFVTRLAEEPFRGHAPVTVLDDEVVRGQFMREVADSLRDYKAPPVADPARLGASARGYMLAKLGVA